jgi:hypothetical protein
MDSPFPAAPSTRAITNAKIKFKMVLKILVIKVFRKSKDIIIWQK